VGLALAEMIPKANARDETRARVLVFMA